MALSRTYYSVNGKIRGEHRSGETHSRDYLHDALGSIVAVFQNGNQVAEGVYKPYGFRDGEWQMDSYKFSWNGGWGYRRTGMSYIANYVRARHYTQFGANWNTVDPLWPSEMPYGYVWGMVQKATDPSGMLTFGYCIPPQNEPLCGTGYSIAQWKLNSNELNGWIVQKVTVTVDRETCAGSKFVDSQMIYWEAWKVVNGSIKTCTKASPGYVNAEKCHDVFEQVVEQKCKSGSITWCGEFAFYSGESLGSDFICDNGRVPQAGKGLWSTNKRPTWWSSLSTQSHDMRISFTCCAHKDCDSGQICGPFMDIWSTEPWMCKK